LTGFNIALCKAHLEAKDIDGALCYLDKAAYHSIEYDKPEAAETNQPFEHTSIIFEREPGDDNTIINYSRSSDHNSSYGLLEYLNDKQFDAVRENSKFMEIIQKLEQYAKKAT
jgi:hypothetical protein